MPTVPRLTSATVESRGVGLVPQSAAGATPEVFGAGVGRALQASGQQTAQTGDDLARIALKEQIEDNERAAKNLDIQLREATRTIVSGDGTAQNPGFYSSRGEVAISQREGAVKSIQEAYRKITEGVQNKRVLELFGPVAAGHMEQTFGAIDRHTQEQRRAANIATSTARATAFASDAITAYTDPEAMKRSLAGIAGEAAAQADLEGFGPEAAAINLQKQQSAVIEGAVKAALAAEDTVTAERIFAANKDSLLGPVRAEIVKDLRDGSVRARAQALRDSVLAKYPNDPAGAREYIKSVADGKTEDAALAAYEAALNAARGDKAEARADEADKQRIVTRAREEVNHAHVVAERERIETQRAAHDSYVSKIIAGTEVSRDTLALDKRLDGEHKATILGMLNRADKGEPLAEVSHAATMDLLRRIQLPEGDPQRIIDEIPLNQAYINGELKRTDLDWVRKQLADLRTADGQRLSDVKKRLIQSVSPMINQSIVGKQLDPTGASRVYAYTQWVEEQVKKAVQNGEDPYELFKADGPKFIGSPAALAPYLQTLEESMRSVREMMQRGRALRPESYKDLGELKAAVDAKKITREQGIEIAKKRGWGK